MALIILIARLAIDTFIFTAIVCTIYELTGINLLYPFKKLIQWVMFD